MAFVLFAAGGRLAGSDLYARRLAATLGAKVVAIAVSASGADEAATASAQAGWEALDGDARPLISGMVLAAFRPIAERLSLRRTTVLMDEPRASAKEMLASVPLIVASSEAAAEVIAAGAALPRERVSVVEPPTPALPRAAGSGGEGAVIVTQDEPAMEEAQAVLFKALAGLFDLDWRLFIVGPAAADPANVAALASCAEQFGLAGRINCEVRAHGSDDLALWRRSDLFASGVARHGYALATAAAMKRGLPVAIAGDAKSAPSIASEAGAVAPPGDHAQLAKALRRMIFDRELRALMAEAAWRAGQNLPNDSDVRERLSAALG
ncbi:MAG: glycosyltransferase [Acetobacteraceae bacterium]